MRHYQNATTSTSDLEASLRAYIEALTQQAGGAVPVLQALRVVTDDLFAEHRGPVQAIVEAVAYAHGLTVAEMLVPSRERALRFARHHAMWEIRRRRPDVPLVKIAAWLNRLDHTTVINSLKRFEAAVASGAYAKERTLVERALSC